MLKLVTGKPGRGINTNEPKPNPTLPDPPAHLTSAARAEWDRLAGELHALGMLTQLDRAILAGFCQAYADVAEAEENLAKYGKLLKSPSRKITRRRRDGTETTETIGGFPMQSPYLAIRNRALVLMARFAVELGLTPSSRGRVSVKPPAPPSPGSKYFE